MYVVQSTSNVRIKLYLPQNSPQLFTKALHNHSDNTVL
jgi:hypothetical protein